MGQWPVARLAGRRREPYPFVVKARWREGRRVLWAAGAGVVVCTVAAVVLFLNAYGALTRSAFRDRAATYAHAFAATAGTWIERGETEVAQTLAGFVVAGSVRSVEIIADNGAVLLRAGTDGEERDRGLIVETSLSPAGGVVRMLVDDSSAVLATRHTGLLAVSGGLAFDVAVIALLAWALRSRRAPAAAPPPATNAADAGRITIGDLVIVPSRCEAWYAGTALRLTPKQFALLSVLASDPGRVFSEAEILAGAWPDSAYADARDIKQYVYLVRRRLAEVRAEGKDVIVTVPGFGYRLADGR